MQRAYCSELAPVLAQTLAGPQRTTLVASFTTACISSKWPLVNALQNREYDEMRIFVSHSSAMTPFIRSLREHFPDALRLWIDVDRMVVTDRITNTLRNTIQSHSDYVLLFVDQHAARSSWVQKEIEWALEEETLHERVILIPVVVDIAAWEALPVTILKDRKYTHCSHNTDPALAAKLIVADLLALLWRELAVARRPQISSSLEVVAEADEMLTRSAKVIRKIIFPYRKSNPMTADKLMLEFDKSGYMPGLKRREFDSLVRRLMQQDLLPGVIYDGFGLYIEEEHYKWKRELSSDKKTIIARAAARELKSDSTIILDSGSSTEALVDVICNLVELGALKDLRVLTNSTRAVSKLLDTVVQLASDEATAPIKVYVTGGVVRPNTLAIVGYPTADQTDFDRLVESLGGGDIAFVGVNGIDAAAGFTTHTNAETHTKRAILGAAKRRCILGDSAKFGIIEPSCFASLDDEVELFTNDDEISRKQASKFNNRGARIHLIKGEADQ